MTNYNKNKIFILNHINFPQNEKHTLHSFTIMAALLQSPSFLTILLHLSIFFLLVHLCYSTSRTYSLPHHHHHSPSSTIRLPLRHVDSSSAAAKNLTKLQRLQQYGLPRSTARLHRFSLATATSSTPIVQSPVYAGSGAYITTLSIGTPSLSFPVILDTGSDLIWTQCSPCSQCFHQPTPIFDPSKSSSFSTLKCSSHLCSALPTSACTSQNACVYAYSYGDSSSTQGLLASETFSFSGSPSIPDIGFGCGQHNQGDGFQQASGLVGLGRGPLSLISQLHEPKFSYCLTSVDETDQSEASTLFLGSFPEINTSTTRLLTNPSLPSFYYLSLQGISVGDTKLHIDESTFEIQEDGSGGMIIDSGTTITYLEQSAYVALRKEIVAQTSLAVHDSQNTGLDLCFSLPEDSSSEKVRVPKKVVFHFDGADLEIPTENFIVGDSTAGVACLAMGSSTGLSILGNIQQQNVLVNYDVNKEAISFASTRCDAL